MPRVVLRINSHRAGRKLRSALGGKRLQYYYTWEHGGRFVVVTEEQAKSLLPIKGITRSRTKFEDLGECWGSDHG